VIPSSPCAVAAAAARAITVAPTLLGSDRNSAADTRAVNSPVASMPIARASAAYETYVSALARIIAPKTSAP